MRSPDHGNILRALLEQPTAPFAEHAVIAQVERFARGHGLRVRRDGVGNLLLRLPARGRRGRPWLFQAHLDHPGFVVTGQRGRVVRAQFRGSVRPQYFRGAPVRFFADAGEVRGRIVSARPERQRSMTHCRVQLEGRARLLSGTVGMWDFPGCRFRGRRVVARGCDDVAGVAAVLCALHDLAATRRRREVLALLTRAEEGGFLGALGAWYGPEDTAVRRALARSWVVGVECPKAQPPAPVGGGAIVRVGDRMQVFDRLVVAHISAVADRVARREPRFRWVRQLMSGGGTEASIWCLAGYQAGSVCLPLDNYHNMGTRGRVAAEEIDRNDFASVVRLLVALATDPATPEQTETAMRRRLRKRFGLYRGLF
ncbi:hypothetical protein HQ590_10080 [bacterium]|nr:hypothetical protein [bacterium]